VWGVRGWRQYCRSGPHPNLVRIFFVSNLCETGAWCSAELVKKIAHGCMYVCVYYESWRFRSCCDFCCRKFCFAFEIIGRREFWETGWNDSEMRVTNRCIQLLQFERRHFHMKMVGPLGRK
jgi:hypothetical protein